MICPKCKRELDDDAVVCPNCGKQVKELKSQANPTVINIENSNTNRNSTGCAGNEKHKAIALLLCFFLGALGAHRFYEGKIGTGLLWLFTAGLCGIGVVVDFIILLFKPSVYYV